MGMNFKCLYFAYMLVVSLAMSLQDGYCAIADTSHTKLDVIVKNTKTGTPLSFPNCFLKNIRTGKVYACGGDDNGVCRFRDVSVGKYRISVLYFGDEFDCGVSYIKEGMEELIVHVNISPMLIGEVTVTATQPKGNVTKSVIGRDAIEHIQPSSIADVLELIPGGMASDPVFSSAQTIRLREASPIRGYNTSSLGTQFTVDGVPVSTNANLQATPAYSSLGSSFLNSGVDMRSISTDDIESIEIVRGIASAEYGDLTSGMVNIRRKQGGRTLEGRFKSDMKSKLFYVGKGFESGQAGEPLKINAGVGYLDAKADPRNIRQSYKRLTGSLRLNRSWNGNEDYIFSAGGSFDYTGSFDDEKSDQDLDFGDMGPVEKYKSSYNRFSAVADFNMSSRKDGFFRRFNLQAALSADMDVIDRWKYVVLGTETPLSTAREEGEYNVGALPARYEATMSVEGIPFNAFVKATSHFAFGSHSFRNNMKTGVEWNMDKNFGRGVIFDVERPFSPDMNVRPRAFNSIPALHRLSVFAEDNIKAVFGQGFMLEAMVGLRASALLNIGNKYSLQGKINVDPRLNFTLVFPSFGCLGDDFGISLSAGAGLHTKYPTMDYLFPETIYYDITQMNYWPADKDKRLVNLRVFRIDPVNFDLAAAKNFKWEIRADFAWKDNTMSVTYFREDMKSGFRYQGRLVTFVTKDYDEQSVDSGSLDGPPDLSSVPYVLDTLLTTYSVPANGSRTLKEGVEFSFTSARIRPIMTRITVNGAWFRTIYRNSLPDFYQPLSNIGGEAYPYIGYYSETEGYLRESFNTNFTFDTQIPRLGLIFTASFQCMWFVGSQSLYVNPYPDYYIDNKAQWHEFTQESASDGLLAQMIRNRDESVYRYNTIPFCMNINLKVTKTLFRDKLSLSVFVNKILDYTPAYYSSMGILVRRSVQPYFGMELNVKI